MILFSVQDDRNYKLLLRHKLWTKYIDFKGIEAHFNCFPKTRAFSTLEVISNVLMHDLDFITTKLNFSKCLEQHKFLSNQKDDQEIQLYFWYSDN